MDTENIAIRTARPEDAARLLGIYAYYVESTAITFEYTVPTVDEFRSRIDHTLERYPYLVIERNGVIQGYAYAGVFKERAAYDEAMQAGREIVELITDAQSADAALAPLAALEHALTSKAEISNIYKARLKTLGLRYNAREKHHEVLADAKPAE